MKARRPTSAVLPLAALCAMAAAPGVEAHIVSLIPDRPAVRLHDRAAGTISFGHPFEHEIRDMAPPESLKVHAPGGSVIDLVPRLETEKVAGPEGKEAARYRFGFEPGERGDFLIALAARPRFVADEGVFLRDFVKVVVHVQGERGWDRAIGDPLEVVPLTRPYGLRPGAVFQARALLDGKPIEGEVCEIERYNAERPRSMPEDEFITRTVRTGPGGLIAATLDEPGWWSITVASRQRSARTAEGKEAPRTLRATFWVYVGEPLARP